MVPTAFAALVVYNLTLESILSNYALFLSESYRNFYKYRTSFDQRQIIIDSVHKARSVVCFFLIWNFAFIALNLETRFESLWYRLRRPLNFALLVSGVFAFCIYFSAWLFLTGSVEILPNKKANVYFVVALFLTFVWPIVITTIVEVIKKHDRYYVRMQEMRRRLVFDTKLGYVEPEV